MSIDETDEPRPTRKLSVEVENFRRHHSGSLIGFLTVFLPQLHLRIREITVHEKNGQRWVGLPGRPQINKDGSVRRDDQTGKVIYTNIIELTDRATRDAFSKRTIASLVAAFPEAFDGEEAAS